MNTKLITFWIFIAGLSISCSPRQSEPTTLENPASANSKYPYLYYSPDALYMSWISEADNQTELLFATYDGNQWSQPHSIAADSSWFVNWADFPSIVAHNGQPMATHWLNKKAGGTYSYDINLSTYHDNKWSAPFTPHLDNTNTEHGFASIIPWGDNTILAVWLDGRRTANRSEKEYYDINKAMTLRGALITTDGKIKKKFLIDDAVCDCCQTTLTKTDHGAIVAYRNRTDKEVRDIYISRFDGKEWSKSKAVHNDGWNIGACPVNGPAISASDSLVAVVWHTGAQNAPSAKVAVSTDYGNHFSAPKTLGKTKSIGRVDAKIYKDKIYISWMEATEEKATLQVATLSPSLNTIQITTVGTLPTERSTGFPQMEIVNEDLIFAWTKADSTGSSVITKKLPLPL